MTDNHHSEPDAESIDTGRPISILRDIEEPVPDTFMGSLNRRIQRRLLTADVSRLTWNGPIKVVLEILNLIFQIGVRDSDKRKE